MKYFRISFFYQLFIAFISTSLSAQTVQKYGNNMNSINSNSVLELESSNKGLLLPRIALVGTAAFTPLSAHVAGMTVYNTATTSVISPGIYTNDGEKWVRVTDSTILSSYLPITGGSISGQLTSTVAVGIAPFVVTSTTPVTNLSIGGNAATATNATNANNAAISSETATSSTVYPTFVTGTAGDLPLIVADAAKLSFIPSTGILTATGFAGSGAGLTGIPASSITTGILPIANGGTGSDTQNFIDLTTTQTIAGSKSFSSDLNVNNITIGSGGGNRITNTAIGMTALTSNTTGIKNTAMGALALDANTTGQGNTANGFNGLFNNTTGSDNTALGVNGLINNTTGSNNTAIGSYATVASGNLTNATAIGYNARVDASNTIQLGDALVTNLKTSGTITSGAVTYPNVDGTANQVLSTTGSGTLAWNDVTKNITSSEVTLTTKINGVQLYAIQGSFTASGTSTAVSVPLPAGIKGYYSMSTYINGKTFRKEIFSFDTSTASNNVITGTGPYSEVYPAGTYNYVLEYFK
jgi:hypothetical protein